MNHLKLLLLRVDCFQDILTREQFHNYTQKLKLFPEYFEITKKKFN